MPNPKAKKVKIPISRVIGKTDLLKKELVDFSTNGKFEQQYTTRAPDLFTTYLGQLYELHERKSKDYGTGEDPLNNIRASEKMGIPAWKGALLRMGDKFARLQKFAKDGKLANESAIDSLNDIAVYSLICRQLLEETTK